MSAMIGQARGSTGMSRSNASTGMGNKIPKGYEQARLQQFTPEQMQLFQSMFSNLGPDSQLSKLAGGDQEAFNQLEAPAIRQFAGVQGGLASRFSGMGTGGRHSSGFQNTATQAGSDFAQQLQSRRMELQRQAQQDLFGMSRDLLSQRPYEQFLTEKEQPWWKQLLNGLGNVGGQALGGLGSRAADSFSNKIFGSR
jgi:hypothetical protein